MTAQQEAQFLAYARQRLRGDPLALEEPPASTYREGQLTAMRGGANLETAYLICGAIGAFPYTDMTTRWEEIIDARESMDETMRIWTPFAKAFQSLDFKFLDMVDVNFAKSIREDGCLESFRSLLRRIGKDAGQVASLSSLESYVRDCKDELMAEYQKTQAEWNKIEEAFLKWAGGGMMAAATSSISGHFIPDIASLSAAVLNALGQLWVRHMKRGRFRKANPMSVFVDLSRKEPRGPTLI